MEYKDITEKIIGCAYKVYNEMGFGFLASVYDNVYCPNFIGQDLKQNVNLHITGKAQPQG